MDTVIENIVGGVIILIGVAGAYLITRFAAYWSAKKEDIITGVKASSSFARNEIISYLLDHIANVVDDVVAAMNTKFKPELLAATEDGKLTKEDGRKLRDKALDLIMTELPDSIWEELADVVGDGEEYVKTLIEKFVDVQKSNSNELVSVETTEDFNDENPVVITTDEEE